MTIDPTISTAALAAAEVSINKLLDYDPGTRIALADLSGQVLAITCTAPAITIYLAFTDDGLNLLGHCESGITTQLRGTAVALASLMGGNTTSLANSGVEIYGSTGLLSQLQKIIADVDIDWEEPLTQIFGDLLGHQSAEYIRWRLGYLRDRLKNGTRLGREFITEELASTPAKPELEYFYQQVDELRLGADRAEAKLQALLKRVSHS